MASKPPSSSSFSSSISQSPSLSASCHPSAAATLRGLSITLTIVCTSLISSQVTKSRPHPHPHFSPPASDFYIFNCTTVSHLSLPESLFTTCTHPILLPPSSIKALNPNPNPSPNQLLQTLNPNPNSLDWKIVVAYSHFNLVDWQILVAQGLMAVYALAMATLLRPGLSFELTQLSLLGSFYIAFTLYNDSKLSFFGFVVFSVYGYLVLTAKAYIVNRAMEAKSAHRAAMQNGKRQTKRRCKGAKVV